LIEQLYIEGKLPEVDDRKLYFWKIGPRIYDLEKDGNILLFKIERHHDASDPMRMDFVTEQWQFDVNDDLKKLELVDETENEEANYEYQHRFFGDRVGL
jgi:hypothetical protein